MSTELLVNGGFNTPAIAAAAVILQPNGNMPGWLGVNGSIEQWGSTAVVPAHPIDGGPKIEVDQSSRPYQIVNVPFAERTLQWRWSMRARTGGGNRRVILRLGDASLPFGGGTLVDDLTLAPGAGWSDRTGTWVKPAGITQVRFELTAGISGANNAGVDYTSLLLLDQEFDTCGCCSSDIAPRCYIDQVNDTNGVAVNMLCDDPVQAVWFDVETGTVLETGNIVLFGCSEFTEVEVEFLPDQFPGARRMRWGQTAAVGIGGDVDGQGTCRESGRIVHGPCAPGFGAWNQISNNVGVGSLSGNDGGSGGGIWAAVEGWVLVPTSVGATVPLGVESFAGICEIALETGTNPSDRVLRSISNTNLTTFVQPVVTCNPCLTDLGYNVAFIRGMVGDGFNLWSLRLMWDIGAGFVPIPQNSLVPTDGNDHVPLDARDFCVDVLPTFLLTTTAWRRNSDNALFEDDLTTPKPVNGAICSVTPI